MTSHPQSPTTPIDRRPIVVGYDGRAASDDALDRGIAMARALEVPLHVLTAWEHALQFGGGLAAWTEDRIARGILDDAMCERFGSSVPAWITTEARLGGAAQMLIHESAGAQMLVVGSHGHGRVVGLIIGSVSAACVQQAACPVLVTHGALSLLPSLEEARARRRTGVTAYVSGSSPRSAARSSPRRPATRAARPGR